MIKVLNTFVTLLLCFFVTITSAYADIKIGTVYFYPPFVISDGTGFDEQLVRKICQDLDEKCTIFPMHLNQIYDAINHGTIDAGIGGITINAAGNKNLAYSLPYILSKGRFLVTKKSNIDSIQQLKGQRIGIIEGGRDGDVFSKHIQSHYPGFFDIVTYNDADGLINALNNNQVAAIFTHESSGLYWQINGGEQFKLVGPPEIVGDGIGIIASKNNQALIQKINQELLRLQNERFYLNLYTTYFSSE